MIRSLSLCFYVNCGQTEEIIPHVVIILLKLAKIRIVTLGTKFQME